MKRYICDFQACCYKTDHSGHLARHKRSHTGEKPFKCNKCDFACTQAENLVTHKRTHTGEKPYKCNECDFACAQAAHLVTHKRTHTGQKPYKCNECNFACSESGSLTKHKRSHTGEKPFKCNKCDFACTQAGNLLTHQRTHSGEKPYKCNECDFTCAQAGDVVKHKRTHTGEKPYKCNECNFACSNSGNLAKHKRTHTGEKPFPCDQCAYRCTTFRDLVTHKRTHSGEKPYKCNECDFACTQASNLARHKQCWHTVIGIQRKKMRENALMASLQKHYTVDREQQINYSCFESQKKFARVDGVIYLGNLTVIVECDEDQHKFYNDSVSCEVARMNNVNTAILCSGNGADLKILWLRVSRDGFTGDGVRRRVKQSEKFARVVDVIGRYQKDGFEGQVGVIYMFYDTEGGVPSITRDDAYSLHFKPYILEKLF